MNAIAQKRYHAAPAPSRVNLMVVVLAVIDATFILIDLMYLVRG